MVRIAPRAAVAAVFALVVAPAAALAQETPQGVVEIEMDTAGTKTIRIEPR